MRDLYLSELALGLLRHGAADDAQTWFAKLEKADPDSYRTLAIKTQLLAKQGQAAETVPALRALVAKKPEYLAPAAGLAGLLLSLLRRDVPPPAIVTFVARIAGAVRALDPRLAYLRVADPDTAFRALVARRGAATLDAVVPGFLGLDFAERTRLRGLDLLLAYWRAHYEVLRAPRGRRARPRRAAVASQPPVYGRAATPPEPPRGVSLSTLTYRGWSSRLCASIWRRRLRCRIH